MKPSIHRALVGLTIILQCATISAQVVPEYFCSPENGTACTEACCSPYGYCGYGPDFCSVASRCIPELSQGGTCDLLSPCDPGIYPGWGAPWGPTYAGAEVCPLQVCCSQFGFCGTTSDFCGNTTVTQPATNETASSMSRTIGYYEGWSLTRPCDQMAPSKIPVDAYTHLLYSFLAIDPITFEVVPASPEEVALFPEFTALKKKKAGLEVWLSIGGWAFNDAGPTAATFSQLVASTAAQATFFTSLLSFMTQYGFDGVDIDWEYPVTPDRNGSVADFTNYVNFMSSLRAVLDKNSGTAQYGRYGLSMTLPSSYWYMQNFNIVLFVKTIDWFNVMTYDLHGTWDAFDPYIGNIMLAHTNLTEIIQTMDLLWRNAIDPQQVSMGYGFYGRSFTASSPDCLEAGCQFSSGANAGPCTQSPGILSFLEIEAILNDSSRNPTITLDPVAAVQIVTWDSDQWVSFDNLETIQMKQAYANSRGIGGQMVWAVSLDSGCGIAASYLAGTADECVLSSVGNTSTISSVSSTSASVSVSTSSSISSSSSSLSVSISLSSSSVSTSSSSSVGVSSTSSSSSYVGPIMTSKSSSSVSSTSSSVRSSNSIYTSSSQSSTSSSVSSTSTSSSLSLATSTSSLTPSLSSSSQSLSSTSSSGSVQSTTSTSSSSVSLSFSLSISSSVSMSISSSRSQKPTSISSSSSSTSSSSSSSSVQSTSSSKTTISTSSSSLSTSTSSSVSLSTSSSTSSPSASLSSISRSATATATLDALLAPSSTASIALNKATNTARSSHTIPFPSAASPTSSGSGLGSGLGESGGGNDLCAGIVGVLQCPAVSFAIYGWEGDCGIGSVAPCVGACEQCLPDIVLGGELVDDNGMQCALVKFA